MKNVRRIITLHNIHRAQTPIHDQENRHEYITTRNQSQQNPSNIANKTNNTRDTRSNNKQATYIINSDRKHRDMTMITPTHTLHHETHNNNKHINHNKQTQTKQANRQAQTHKQRTVRTAITNTMT